MSREIIHFFSNKGTRNEVRKRVVDIFIEEEPGRGKKDLASKYIYKVEQLIDGRYIFLTRPANLKNGFDFLIRVEDIDFNLGNERVRDYPKHDDLLNDLSLKKNYDETSYQQLYSFIRSTFDCNEIEDEWFEELNLDVGYPCDLVVKTIKWFFIEQDIRYWNYSGRNMLMSEINKI